MILVLAFELLEKRNFGFLGELKGTLSLLLEMNWFIECVALAFVTLFFVT